MIRLRSKTDFAISRDWEKEASNSRRSYLIHTTQGGYSVDTEGLRAIIGLGLNHLPSLSDEELNVFETHVANFLDLWRTGQVVTIDVRQHTFTYSLDVDGRVEVDRSAYYIDVIRIMTDDAFDDSEKG